MNIGLLNNWLHLLIYATLSTGISTHRELWKPGIAPVAPQHRIHHAAVAPRQIPHQNLTWTPRISGLHDYQYQFRGRALYKGLPVAHASVVLRVMTNRDSIVRGAITDADGNYAIEIMVCGKSMDSVQWVMRSYTPESRPVELEGSRIIMQEDEKVIVQSGLDLLAS